MKLILKQTVEKLGESGEVVDVKPGYARNYLIPQGLAYVATDANLKRVEEERLEAEERARREYLEARRRAAQLEGASVSFAVRAGDDGKLFGSITSSDIAEQLNANAGLDFEVDRRHIEVEDPLKQLGTFEVSLKLHSQVSAPIEVQIERGED